VEEPRGAPAVVSDAGGPRLLARERDELDRVASLLREGRRVVAFLVGEARLRPAVLAYLRERSGVAIPEPVALADPDQTLDVLERVNAGRPSEVWTLLVDHAAANVLRTLNWHREKLRRGASSLLWIDGVEGLRALRATAPDAYSFRDVMIAIQGEEPVPVVPPEAESMDVQLARLEYAKAGSPEDRAEAAARLGNRLRVRDSNSEARSILNSALAVIPGETYTSERARTTRAHLYFHLTGTATKGSADALRYCRRGIDELEGLTSSESHGWKLFLLGMMTSPLGFDQRSVLRALAEIRPAKERPEVSCQVLRGAARSWIEHGDLLRAGKLVRDALNIADLAVHNRAMALEDQGRVDLYAGHIARAEERYRASYSLVKRAGIGTSYPALWLATCSQLQGELEVAKHILADIAAQPENIAAEQFNARRQLAEITMAEGDVPRALTDLRTLLHAASSSRNDGDLYQTAFTYVSSLRATHEAGRLIPADLTDADAELDVAEDVALSIARDDPPWYPILFPALRAEVLSLRPGHLAEAISLTAAAVDRARAVWPDAAPMHARMLVAHLVRAGRLDEARDALALAEPEAEAQRHLRELARLRAHAVAVLARTAVPAAAIDAKMSALRATLDETGAPRIAADTLLELAQLLPPACAQPDPLSLLDEAAALFAEMPIPAQEARCLEGMGDVLAARGDAAARGRHLEAKGTCERYGLGLRVPLLDAKLAR
jgi:tetratricopeptide (TPR) repeat protein